MLDDILNNIKENLLWYFLIILMVIAIIIYKVTSLSPYKEIFLLGMIIVLILYTINKIIPMPAIP